MYAGTGFPGGRGEEKDQVTPKSMYSKVTYGVVIEPILIRVGGVKISIG